MTLNHRGLLTNFLHNDIVALDGTKLPFGVIRNAVYDTLAGICCGDTRQLVGAICFTVIFLACTVCLYGK